MNIAVAERMGIEGLYVATLALPERAPREYGRLLDFLRTPFTRPDHFRDVTYKALLKAYHDKAAIKVFVERNLSPVAGRTALARRLAADTTYTGIVNYVAIGTGSTAPSLGDTALDTEAYRKTFDDTTYVNNVAYLSAFIAAGVATGTYTEAGLFIDGGAGADSGQILSRVLFSPQIVKAALLSLTLEAVLTVS
jgi:hypothetical protein